MNDRDCIHGQLSRSCQLCDYESEISRLKTKVQSMEKDVQRYNWLRNNVTEELTKGSIGEFSIENKTQYVLPLLLSWADFCGNISFDEAIDFKIDNEQR